MRDDGQHRGDGRAAVNNGQRSSRFDKRSHVGNLSGGESHDRVPPSDIDSDIETTRGSAGPLSPGEKRGGADDRR